MRVLTRRQRNILEVINRFGIITSTQLIEYLVGQVSHDTVYNAIKKLKELNLVAVEKVSYSSVVYIRPTGVRFLDSNMSKFTVISYANLEHHLLCNDVILALIKISKQRGAEYSFVTERELRSEFIDKEVPRGKEHDSRVLRGIPDRIPDLIFTMGGDVGAYEVELNRKSSKRYIEKLSRYEDEILNKKYDFVFYVCESEEIQNTVVANAKKVKFPSDMLQIDLLGRLLKFAD